MLVAVFVGAARATLPVEPFPELPPRASTCADDKLKAVSKPGVSYPRKAVRDGQTGWVVLEFDIREDGATTNFKVIGSSPPGFFDAVVIDAVYKWKYEPGEARIKCRTETKFKIDGYLGDVRD
jgi:protein TonB